MENFDYYHTGIYPFILCLKTTCLGHQDLHIIKQIHGIYCVVISDGCQHFKDLVKYYFIIIK